MIRTPEPEDYMSCYRCFVLKLIELLGAYGRTPSLNTNAGKYWLHVVDVHSVYMETVLWGTKS